MKKLFTSSSFLNLRRKWIFFSLFSLCIFKSFGQYTFTNNLPVSEIAGTGTAIPNVNTLQQIPIGFSFSFYGTSYTDVYLAQNGALRFGSGLAGGVLPYDGPSYYSLYYSNNRNMISFALSSTLKPGVYSTPIMNYFTTGTAPNRILVINFKNISLNDNSLASNPDAIVSVQLQLYEGSNTIEVHNIKNKSFGTGFSYYRTFGISNSTGGTYAGLSGYDYVNNFNLDNRMVRIQNCTPSAAPSFTKSAATIACGGDAVTLTGSGCVAGSTYSWSNGAVGNPIVVNPKLTTDYSVACLSADHCLGTSSVAETVTVTNPSPTITSSGTVICPSSTKTLTANVGVAGGTYQWFRNGTLLSGSTSSTYLADSATKFKVRYTIGSCTMLSDSIVMTRGVMPAKPTVTGPTTFCSGNGTSINTNGCTGTINWVSGTTGSNTSLYVSPSVTTKYAATCTNADGCVSATSDTLTLTPITTAAPTISSNLTTVCGGDSVTLTATGCVGTVQWTGGLYGSILKRLITGTTSFTAQCVDNGCTSVNSNSITITVTEQSPTVSTSNYYNAVCLGDTLTMTASTVSSGGTWQWYKNGVAISTNGTNNIYKGYQNGNYQVAYITSACSAKSIPITLTVLSGTSNVPTITSTVTTLCSSDYVYLSSTGCASNENTYWYRDGSQYTTGNTISIYQSAASTVYTARCSINSNAPYYTTCVGSVSNSITVTISSPSSPTGLAASATTVACGGSTPITLTASGCTGVYSWSANANTNSTSATVTVTPTATTTYSVRCKSAIGCLSSSSSSATITVTNSIPTISPSDTVSACPGTSGLLLTATTPTSGGTLQWTNDLGDISGETSSTYTATATDNYLVKQTVASCVLTSKPTRVIIGSVKAPKITISGPSTSCYANSFYFNSTGCTGTTTWSNGNIGTSTSIYLSSGSQYVWAKCSQGTNCNSPKSDSIQIRTPSPVEIYSSMSPTFCTGGSFQLNASTVSTGLTYKWKLNGTYISGATSNTYNATVAGVYTLETTLGNCTQTTAAYNLSSATATAPVITGSTASCSATPQKIWDKRFGGTSSDYFTCMLSSGPTEYLIGGYSASGQNGDKTQPSRGADDFWIVKVDSSGAKLWDRRYGGSEGEQLNRMVYASDGNLILGGSSYSGLSGDRSQGTRGSGDYWIIKTDIANGNVLWNKRFGGSGNEYLKDVLLTADNGYLLGGYSYSPQGSDKTNDNKGYQDIWIVKTDASGTKLWDKNYGSPSGYNYLSKILAVSGGGYLLCGYSDQSAIGGDKSQNPRGSTDFWIIKIDANGNKIWDKVIGGSNSDVLFDAVAVTGGFVLVGESYSGISGDKTSTSKGSADYWLVKIDNNGSIVWDKTIGGSNSDYPRGIKTLSDGSLLVMGYSQSGISGDKTEASISNSQDYWIVKTDANGNKIWDKIFGSTYSDVASDFIVNSDDSYVLGGHTDGTIGGDKTQNTQGSYDYWIVKAKGCQTTAVPSSIVAGQTVTLTANGCSGTITWSGGITATGTTVSVTPSTTSAYTATCTVAGCVTTQSSSITLTVIAIPTPTIGANPSPAITCTGSPVTLTATGCPGGSTFVWTPAGSGSGVSITVTPTANTNYTVACVVNGSAGPASASSLVKNVSQITSIASGDYNVPTTWDCDCVPLACSVVTINPLHNVVIQNAVTGKAKDVVMKGNLEIKQPTGKLSLNMP